MKRYLFYLISTSLILISCREEIIPPNNPAGAVNSPVKYFSQNSYSFVINAENISYTINDYTFFDVYRSRAYINLIDYRAGSVEVNVLERGGNSVFNKKCSNDIEGESSDINGYLPFAIVIKFTNFTGKFNFKLTR